jgi:cell division septation protein DedD
MAFFVVCLFALGLSFFFGLMAGLSGRPGPSAAAMETPTPASEAASGEGAPGSVAATSETPLTAENSRESATPAGEPTAPAILQAFADRAAEPTPQVSAKRASPGLAPAPPGSGVWIQVASLAARGEADALVVRLSRHGYRAQTEAAQSPKGRVFRVRVGPYRSEEEATRAAEKLRRQENIRQTWVVRAGR